MVVVEGEVYRSDSDSDDDDVDRFVFLARQPAPVPGRHAEDDRGASSANDDDDDDGDATADEDSERDGGRRKRPLGREILDDAPPPPPPKKARVKLIAIAPPLARTPPSGSESETESDSAPLPCDVRARGSGSEESHGKAAHEHRARGRGGEAKNAIKKKRGACGKRGRGPGREEDGDPESRGAVAAAAKAGASPAATSGSFLCNLCERCFDSHQALGGHVLGHRKKTKIAIAAAASLDDIDDADGVGNCKDETAVVEVNEETASGIAQTDKMAAVAARRGKANGGCHGKIKTVADVADHRRGVDSRAHEHVNGNADLVNKGSAVSGDDFTNGNSTTHDKTDTIGAEIPNQKVVAGTCHGGANGDGNVRTTMYKCKVCGTECLTGRALGGHMRKHRKRPPLGGGGEGRSPSPATDNDCQIPLARMFGAEAGLQRENKIGLV
ncbi:hypothetical protein GQ55_9G123900 [Panicum hallii var. hallii]|uniref:C2H2-type domain-containing protein n=1 Tax=Panicum hallii var. hallii TaxID=1504633 RepID=A0A2T7C2B9_9POAL|nr:hypothetical protein GQ55_9G123900 [Panicum hallii var. hallii]